VLSPEVIRHGEQICNYVFQNQELLDTALTHSSVATCRLDSNERLEFLGDAVLGLVVCAELYHRYDRQQEGELTKVKSAVVSGKTCAEIADRIGLADMLILGKGIRGRSHIPISLRAAVFESLIGAIYVDGGLEPARRFIVDTILPYIEQAACSENHDNYKSALQQLAQKHLNATPHYEQLDEQGPDHSKSFEVCVVIGHRRFSGAWGPSKKEAEQKAAQIALNALKNGQSETA